MSQISSKCKKVTIKVTVKFVTVTVMKTKCNYVIITVTKTK